MSCSNKCRGFTLIELMLAMGFASILLVAIAMTVIQISNVYNRGVTLKEVDQAGRSISDELQRNINRSEAFKLVTCTPAVPVAGCNFVNEAWGGRLCIGQFSYIWNNGDTLNAISPGTNINIYSGGLATKIRFVKVTDANADYCGTPTRTIDTAGATELLNISQHELAVHSFTISSSVSDARTRQQLYNVSFVLGTNDTTAIMYTPGSDVRCKIPTEAGADPTYCSINKFNILTRAGSVSG